MEIKAIIFDLDGTAIPNKKDGMPSKRLIETVAKAQKKVRVSVATGRPLSMHVIFLKHYILPVLAL
jgi:hydroxymethylpyrimidine pyrophosphatase-like HAD family hydrolase